MSQNDDYVSVTGRIAQIREQSILFTVGDQVPRGDWIPRSLIFGPDEKKLDGLAAAVARQAKSGGPAFTLRMFRWKAEEVGFLGDRDQQTKDLFQRG